MSFVPRMPLAMANDRHTSFSALKKMGAMTPPEAFKMGADASEELLSLLKRVPRTRRESSLERAVLTPEVTVSKGAELWRLWTLEETAGKEEK